MRIAIYSGSFDPVHTGHAMLASWVGQSGIVDEIWLTVSRHNPLKASQTHASGRHRLAMARLVAQRATGVLASDIELSMPVPSYTYRTLCELRSRYPQHQFILLIGADNWLNFSNWLNSREIIDEFGLLIYPRPGINVDTATLPANIRYLEDAPIADISSTSIRLGLASGRNESFFLPDDVYAYIQAHNLYTLSNN